MNALQSNRYMQFIEPMLALIYAYKSLFNVGHDSFRSESLTNFVTEAQQQMQEYVGFFLSLIACRRHFEILSFSCFAVVLFLNNQILFELQHR